MEKKHDPLKSPKPNHVDNWFTYLNADKVQLLKELVEQTTNPVLIPYVNYGVEKCVDQYVGYANDSSIRKEFQLSEERKEHTTINADFTFNYWVTNRSTKHDPIVNPFTDDEKSLTVLDYRIEIRYNAPVIKPHSQCRFVIT